MTRSRATFLVATVAAFALFPACGSSSSDGSSTPGGGTPGGSSAGAGGGSASGNAAADCGEARACCAPLSGTTETDCVKDVNDAEYNSPDPVSACAAALMKYKPNGMCAGAGGAGGSAGAGGASGPITQPTVCARYVTCQSAVSPSMAMSTDAAYGAMGTCWSGTAEMAMNCELECQTALSAFHMSSPDKCPLCVSNQDCSGSTPTCDTTKGECTM